MVYPSPGIALAGSGAWGTSITNNSSNWNTAFGWGNHASAGYALTSSLVNYFLKSDTVSITSPATRGRLQKTIDSIKVLNTISLGLKLNISDTAAMLTNYVKPIYPVDGLYMKNDSIIAGRLFSGSDTGVITPTRWATKENALGNPGTTGYVLSSTTAGVRSWIAMSGGLSSWGHTFTGNELTDVSGFFNQMVNGGATPTMSFYNNGGIAHTVEVVNQNAGNTGAALLVTTTNSLAIETTGNAKIGGTIETSGGIKTRVIGIASSATITPNIDVTDLYVISALATNTTFAAPTGTPLDGQGLMIRIKSDASVRTLTWNSIYTAGSDFALPAATVASKTMWLQFIWNATDSKYNCTGLSQGF